MRLNQITLFFILLFSFGNTMGQTATVSGQVSDEDGRFLRGVSVTILGQQQGISTNDSGRFSMQVRAGKAVGLVFSYTGYLPQQRNFYLIKGETEFIRVMLQGGRGTLQDVTITNQQDRREAGLVKINPKLAFQNPAPIGGIENLIKIFVNSRSELSSQYEVRGGNYDENLVYVNDFEVFRPYLVRSGQQEGLSFINPELARNVNFYNGGFQARYGDKMSSVLDVTYKRPKTNAGSAYIGLLEQGFHLEGASKNQKISWLTGVRNRSLRNLLGSQETKGNYLPNSADLQGLLTYQPNSKWLFELLANMSQTSFTLEPQESQQTTSVFTPLFTSNLGLDIYFTGREEDSYQTRMVGLSATRVIKQGFHLKGMLSYFNNLESENINIAGTYLFGDRSFDRSSADFGQITNPLGAGLFLNYARNQLQVQVMNASLKANIDKPNSDWQIGTGIEQHFINDKLLEFNYQDSAGYNLPNQSGPLELSSSTRGNADLQVTRLSGYVQNNRSFPGIPGFVLQSGVRYNYNTLNKEWLFSPRVGLSYHPAKWDKNIILKLNSGFYHQPVFYREMRDYAGHLNTQMKAQRSFQVSGGFDYAFKGFNSPMRLSVESYYKKMSNVAAYDIDNVRIRYLGNNNAKAYAYGVEARLFGELVKDAESWLSIGWMKAMENLDGDFYQQYFNSAGELINGGTQNQVVADSQKVDIGWLRRPTDRRLSFGMYFSDYLTTNKNFKVFLQTLYGTNLPFNIAGSTRYRNALEIPAYLRVDLGFSYQFLPIDRNQRRSHSPFRNLENIWLNLEVFNLLDKGNVISYSMIKDFENNLFAVPNRLTPRLINLKLMVRW